MINKAINLFFQISNPDEINVTILLKACARIKKKESLHFVKKIVSSAEKVLPEIKTNTISYGNLIHAYKKHHQLEKTLE